MDYIPIEKCEDGYLYLIDSRNAQYGMWVAKEKTFRIVRSSMISDVHLFDEDHVDANNNTGTARPFVKLEKANANNPFDLLTYLQNVRDRFEKKKHALMVALRRSIVEHIERQVETVAVDDHDKFVAGEARRYFELIFDRLMGD